MTIRIVTDSACDIPVELAAKHNITIVPLTFSFGDKEFTDRKSMTSQEFWRYCADSPVLPQTAAPSPGQFTQAFSELVAQGATGIIVICLSRELSATLQSAETGAKELSGSVPIRFVDSRSASIGLGINVIATAELIAAQPSASIETLVATATDLCSRTHVYAALDTLDNLRKGGRISGTKAFIATALAIKPIVEIREGKIVEGGKERTRGKALAFLVDKVRSAGPITNLAVLHAQCSDVDAFVDQLKTFYSGEIVIGDIGAVIGSHTGVGAIGVTFHAK